MGEERFNEVFRRITADTPDAPAFSDLETHRATPRVPTRVKPWMAAGVAALLVLVVVGALGFLGGGGPDLAAPDDPDAQSPEPVVQADDIPPDCPVTIPSDDFTPPDTHPATPANPDSLWFGKNELWTVLPVDGQYHGPRKSVWWSANFPGGGEESVPPIQTTYRLLTTGRDVMLTSERGTNAHTETDGWFMIATIDPNYSGCWEVTATYKGASLTYTYYNPDGLDSSTLGIVPDVVGMTVERAGNVLHDAMYEASFHDSKDPTYEVCAQEPGAGLEINPGAIIGMRTAPPGGCEEQSPTQPPDICRSAEPQPGQVAVFFHCGDSEFPQPQAVVRQGIPGADPIAAVFVGLAAGPTDAEAARGFASFFGPASANALLFIEREGDRLVVNFTEKILVDNASTSNGSIFFLAELYANAFQFEEVGSVEFRINGSCEAFWEFLQAGPTCNITDRAAWEAMQSQWGNG